MFSKEAKTGEDSVHILSFESSKNGGIFLETAIIVPLFFLLIIFFLSLLSCVRAEILLAKALDQVSSELSLLEPLVGKTLDFSDSLYQSLESQENSEQDSSTNASSTNGFASALALLDVFGIEGTDILTTAVLGRAIGSRIEATWSSYYGEDRLLHSRISHISVYVDYDEEAKIIWIRLYYRWQTLFTEVERQMKSAIIMYEDLEIFGNGKSSDEKDEIWLKDNFTRGDFFREHYGGNLPKSYPVIAVWNGSQGTAIKSIDLTAPSYQTEALSESITAMLESLANFQGTAKPWGKEEILIRGDMIQSRKIVLVVPENSPEEALRVLREQQKQAKIMGITLQIEKYGNSYRFQSQDQILPSN